MKSYVSSAFWKAYEKLELDVQRRAKESFRVFQQDPTHPSLQFKKIHSGEDIWSARVGRTYRVLGGRIGAEIVWFWIGSHEEYERMMDLL